MSRKAWKRKGFPHSGPADGQIASAGGLFGGILDQQSENRWFKHIMTGGEHTFTWTYTAPTIRANGTTISPKRLGS